MSRKIYDLIIIGGGAAGMAAALEAVGSTPRPGGFLEKKMPWAKKAPGNGNGRCNLFQ